MPVEDIPSSNMVKKIGHKEHCWNNRSSPAEGEWMKNGLIEADVPGEGRIAAYRMVWVPNPFSRECRQPGSQPPLPGCLGCSHLGEDTEYENRTGRK